LITGIGIDVVHVTRITKWQTIPGILERFFNPVEISDAQARGSGAGFSLAARFAAKEAFGKALGTGLTGIVLKDIMVARRDNGRPEMQVQGSALTALQKNGANRVHLSLTHEIDNAIAMVVLEKLPDSSVAD